jgi:hypothetical protein
MNCYSFINVAGKYYPVKSYFDEYIKSGRSALILRRLKKAKGWGNWFLAHNRAGQSGII